MIKSSNHIKIMGNSEAKADLDFAKFFKVVTLKIKANYKKHLMCECKKICFNNCVFSIKRHSYFKCLCKHIPIKIFVQNIKTKQLFWVKANTNKKYSEFCLPFDKYAVWIEFSNKHTDKILLQATKPNDIIFLEFEI